MNKKFIVANWKMNPVSLKEAEKLFGTIQKGIRGVKGVQVVLCPPFPYLLFVKSQSSNLSKGAQNCYHEQKGAYTGEVSPLMIKDMGCDYVIIGHSERKRYFAETNETINKKIKAALKASLKVILCIGENMRDSFDSKGRWTHELDPKLKEQLIGALEGVKKSQISSIVVAYEPVWAIGTGSSATPDDVFSAKIYIRKVLSDLYDRKSADKVLVLYGGSTNKKNAADFIKQGNMDGLLVGGTSLDANEFISMIKSVI